MEFRPIKSRTGRAKGRNGTGPFLFLEIRHYIYITKFENVMSELDWAGCGSMRILGDWAVWPNYLDWIGPSLLQNKVPSPTLTNLVSFLYVFLIYYSLLLSFRLDFRFLFWFPYRISFINLAWTWHNFWPLVGEPILLLHEFQY